VPITLLTGKPRNGKTLRMMYLLRQAGRDAKRPVFASGIDGLSPGLAAEIADPRTWNDIDPNGTPECDCDAAPGLHAHVLPNGAIWFVDEVWKWFGHLHNAGRQATPGHVLALAEHGHRGIDMVWTTQDPAQVYPFARKLIQEHTHCVRIMGAQACTLHQWPELNEDVDSKAQRGHAVSTPWPYPKDLYGLYKSASEHTVKFKLDRRIPILAGMVLAIAGLFYGALAYMRPDGDPPASDVSAASDAPAGASTRSTPAPDAPASAFEYAQKHIPRFPTMPETAPVYDHREVVSAPEVYCMASEAGEAADGWREASVTCLTEQGTVYELPSHEARRLARYGRPYNAYKQAPQVNGPIASGAAPMAQGGGFAPTADALPGAILRAQQVTGYGQFRPGNARSAP